jgi:hypothetical protein
MTRSNKQRIVIENGGSRELTVNEGIRHAQITEAARRVGKVGWTVYAINPNGILNDAVETQSDTAPVSQEETADAKVLSSADRFNAGIAAVAGEVQGLNRAA